MDDDDEDEEERKQEMVNIFHNQIQWMQKIKGFRNSFQRMEQDMQRLTEEEGGYCETPAPTSSHEWLLYSAE